MFADVTFWDFVRDCWPLLLAVGGIICNHCWWLGWMTLTDRRLDSVTHLLIVLADKNGLDLAEELDKVPHEARRTLD